MAEEARTIPAPFVRLDGNERSMFTDFSPRYEDSRALPDAEPEPEALEAIERTGLDQAPDDDQLALFPVDEVVAADAAVLAAREAEAEQPETPADSKPASKGKVPPA